MRAIRDGEVGGATLHLVSAPSYQVKKAVNFCSEVLAERDHDNHLLIQPIPDQASQTTRLNDGNHVSEVTHIVA